MNLLSAFWKRIFAGLFFLIILVVPHSHVEASENSLKNSQQDSLNVLDSLVRVYRINNPEVACHYGRIFLKLAHNLKDPESVTRSYMVMGLAFLGTRKDSSLIYFNKALLLADSSRLLKYQIKTLYNIAGINFDAERYKQAIADLDSCITIAESIKDYETMSDAYNMLGNINYQINDTASAFKLYEKAFMIAKEDSLYRQMGNALSNLAAKKESDDEKSIILQKEALSFLMKKPGNEEEQALIYINIANRLKNPDSAIYYYSKALGLTEKGKLWQISIGALNNMAYSYIDKNELANAENCIKKAITLALDIDSPDWLSELFDTYADILKDKNKFKEALEMQKKSLRARIEADRKQASGQLRVLAVLLDVKSKELLIQIQQNRLRKVQLWLVISIFVIIAFVFIFVWIQQRFRMKLQHQQISSARRIIEMEEDEKGKTARELHDITGQLVMGITGEIENIEFPDRKSKEELQGKIKDLGKSIRLISHRMNRAMMETFSFEELIEGQCSDVQKLTGIPIHVKIPGEPLTLPPEVILHTYRMVQELLTNASKYVKGHQVWIHINHVSNGFILSYKDDGPGFNTEIVTKKGKGGMGLSNIFERAKLLGGQAVVTSTPEKGTHWEISIPFHKKN